MNHTSRRRGINVLIALTLLVLGLLARWIAIRLTSLTAANGQPFLDDSFYYFALGRHLAAGHGFQIDALHPTTGFQPLWGVLVAIPYLIVPSAPIAGIQWMGVLVSIGVAALCGFITWRYTHSVIASAVSGGLVWLLPTSVVQSINGMETVLATGCALAMFVQLDRVQAHPTTRALTVLGLLSGIAILARVDMIVLFASLLGAWSIFGQRVHSRWRDGLTLILSAALPLLPWIIIALSMGKSPFPESGNAVRWLSQHFTTTDPMHGQHDLALFLSRIESGVYTFDVLKGALAGLPIALMTALLVLIPLSRDVRLRVPVVVLTLWGIGLTVAYVGVIHGNWFFDRYTQPLATVTSVLLIAWLLRVGFRRSHRPLTDAILLSGMALVATFTLTQHLYRGYAWSSGGKQEPSGFYSVAMWLNEHVPRDTRVGVFQSGVIGYYAVMPVVNLDGKVNTDAREAAQAGQMWTYVCVAQLGYVADWRVFIDPIAVVANDGLELLTTIPITLNPDTDFYVYRVNREYCPVAT